MQIVSNGGNLNEIYAPVSGKNKKNIYRQFVICGKSPESGKDFIHMFSNSSSTCSSNSTSVSGSRVPYKIFSLNGSKIEGV